MCVMDDAEALPKPLFPQFISFCQTNISNKWSPLAERGHVLPLSLQDTRVLCEDTHQYYAFTSPPC